MMDDYIKKYKNKLFPYQIGSMKNIVKIIQNNNACLDASETGTGKTYVAASVCNELKLRPIIVCPRAVMANWKKVCKFFDVKPFFIVNYETLKFGKFYGDKGKRKLCPYINYDKEKNFDLDEEIYTWNLSEKDKIIFIFDEVHKCTNFDTFNGQLLISAKKTQKPILILSATLADSVTKIRMFAYILNFIDKNIVEKQKIGLKKYIDIIEKWLFKENKPMVTVHNMLFPDRGTRVRIDIIPDFPETQISAIAYSMDEKYEIQIQQEYEKIAELLDELKEKKAKDKGNVLVALLRARQKIELLKIPTFLELARDFKDEGKSIVIFVNFTQTLKTLSNLLDTDCLIYGEQTTEQREQNINDFQENKEKIIICNISAGGVGISLHDIYGKHPRISLISPTWNAVDLTQCLGRIHRAGGKSKSLQRIIYTANTVEESIADKLQIKLKDMNSINNGDLDLTNISFDRR
jgi:superfamily II DNA or RNA helicase